MNATNQLSNNKTPCAPCQTFCFDFPGSISLDYARRHTAVLLVSANPSKFRHAETIGRRAEVMVNPRNARSHRIRSILMHFGARRSTSTAVRPSWSRHGSFRSQERKILCGRLTDVVCNWYGNNSSRDSNIKPETHVTTRTYCIVYGIWSSARCMPEHAP